MCRLSWSSMPSSKAIRCAIHPVRHSPRDSSLSTQPLGRQVKSWKKRRFVLRQGSLAYAKDQTRAGKCVWLGEISLLDAKQVDASEVGSRPATGLTALGLDPSTAWVIQTSEVERAR